MGSYTDIQTRHYLDRKSHSEGGIKLIGLRKDARQRRRDISKLNSDLVLICSVHPKTALELPCLSYSMISNQSELNFTIKLMM